MTKEDVANTIRSAPSYPLLVKAIRAFYKSLGYEQEQVDERIDQKEPWSLLVVHAQVMNIKSQRAKTLIALSNAIFRETGLPKKPQGKFRGMDGIDFQKLGLE